jgi:hypothetical protein
MRKLNQRQLRIAVEILEHAKGEILSGRREFICHAITFPMYFREARDYLSTWVTTMIFPHTTYEDWLRENGHIGILDAFMHPIKMRRSRAAWIDWMIAELQKEIK